MTVPTPSPTQGLRLPAECLLLLSTHWSLPGPPSRSCWESWRVPFSLHHLQPSQSSGRAPSCLGPAAASAPQCGGWSASWGSTPSASSPRPSSPTRGRW
uniref:Alternative protein LPPR2 n=1 Tax=Homo sapiens TaxID=9606 RepID=L0R5B8_HUMAN|nr:alternative protein LPPR2 [Homo sapiens]